MISVLSMNGGSRNLNNIWVLMRIYQFWELNVAVHKCIIQNFLLGMMKVV